jgi:hypothetical protein
MFSGQYPDRWKNFQSIERDKWNFFHLSTMLDIKMKNEVLHSLLTAKVLFYEAQDLCVVEDRFNASSGLIILQDALELIFLATLIEIGVDEVKALESFSFDQLIGELKKNNIKVPKSGTLKALNKQRVVIKHYGQVAEPGTASNYLEIAQQSIDEVLTQVFDKTLQEIMLHELIRDEEIKGYLTEACEALDQNKFFKSLVSIRKAIFVAIEIQYCIYDWRDVNQSEPLGFLGFGRNGRNAPWHTRNKKWIKEKVRNPFDYIGSSLFQVGSLNSSFPAMR